MTTANLVSYNLNGIRAVIDKGLIDWIKGGSYDIICFQEIKASPEQFDTSLFESLGYACYWFPAEKKGYSGTAILSRLPVANLRYGIRHDLFDKEGRVIRLDLNDTTLVCAYFPSGSMGDERQKVKMEFLTVFTNYIEDLRKERPNIIVTGDFNICHKPIDINNPKRHEKTSGFLPEERAWFDSFVEKGWIDTFREFCSEPERYSWWSYRSRAKEKNLGWRIDYFMVTDTLKERLIGADIFPDVNFSDHCPINLKIQI